MATYDEAQPPTAIVVLLKSKVSLASADVAETHFQACGQRFLTNIWAGGGKVGAGGKDTNFDVSLTLYPTAHVEKCLEQLESQKATLWEED